MINYAPPKKKKKNNNNNDNNDNNYESLTLSQTFLSRKDMPSE